MICIHLCGVVAGCIRCCSHSECVWIRIQSVFCCWVFHILLLWLLPSPLLSSHSTARCSWHSRVSSSHDNFRNLRVTHFLPRFVRVFSTFAHCLIASPKIVAIFSLFFFFGVLLSWNRCVSVSVCGDNHRSSRIGNKLKKRKKSVKYRRISGSR